MLLEDRLFKNGKGTIVHNGSTYGVKFKQYDISKNSNDETKYRR